MPPNSLITQQPVTPEKLHQAKELRREMNPAERTLWMRLRAGRLEGFHFRRQQVIGPYIVDFYCHQAALVIEVDGGVHLEQQEYDEQRSQDLQTLGLRVMRFTNAEVTSSMERVSGEILQACRASPYAISITKDD